MRNGGAVIDSASLEMSVPEELEYKSDINQDIVARNDDLPSGLLCEKGSEKIAHVSETPYDEEEYRKAGS
jgi:hypothetical protein